MFISVQEPSITKVKKQSKAVASDDEDLQEVKCYVSCMAIFSMTHHNQQDDDEDADLMDDDAAALRDDDADDDDDDDDNAKGSPKSSEDEDDKFAAVSASAHGDGDIEMFDDEDLVSFLIFGILVPHLVCFDLQIRRLSIQMPLLKL